MPRAAKNPITGLTPKQEAFCLEYLKNGGNASAAYREAYEPTGKEKTVNEAASRLLGNSKIAARLGANRQAVAEKVFDETALNRAWVVKGLMTVAERCMQARPVLDKKGNPVLIEIENGALTPAFVFDAPGANRAYELCGKEIGMFVERAESGRPGEFERLSTDDLAKQVAEMEAAEAAAKAINHAKLRARPASAKNSAKAS